MATGWSFSVASIRVIRLPPSPEAIKAKLGAALRHLDPRQMLVAPDCGLMTISRALAHDKLQAMVAATRDMRRQMHIG